MQSVEQKKRLLEESHDSLSEELAKLQDQGNKCTCTHASTQYFFMNTLISTEIHPYVINIQYTTR